MTSGNRIERNSVYDARQYSFLGLILYLYLNPLGLRLELPEIDSTKCISRVANNANVTGKTKHQAINLMNDVVKQGISAGKDPMGLACLMYKDW